MNQTFKTTTMQIIVENTTHAGSGFGVTDDGEAVFLSMRLMEVMELQLGDLVKAYCIPNYEDKRDQIPWRAIRVERRSITPDPVVSEPEPVVRTPLEIDAEVFDEIQAHPEPWTTRELSDHLDLDQKTTGNSCMRLFNKGKISKAEIYASAGQERPSFLLWALTADAFK
jgi:hypothetical protein